MEAVTPSESLVVFYTDGSADPKRKDGSWAFVRVENDSVVSEASARVKKTDSARMEMIAVIEALQTLKTASQVLVNTDCHMLIEAMEKFVPHWKANDWRKPKTNLPIPNVDLYKILDGFVSTHTVSWRWVKAHNGNRFNERCDELCRLARGLSTK